MRAVEEAQDVLRISRGPQNIFFSRNLVEHMGKVAFLRSSKYDTFSSLAWI